MTQNRPRPRPWIAEALGRVAQNILETAERGCLSRSMFDKPKTRGISCAHSAIRQLQVGGTVTRHRGQCEAKTSRTV